PALVLLPELPERPLPLPAVEDLELERRMVGLVGKRLEHGFSLGLGGNRNRRSTVYLLVPPETKGTHGSSHRSHLRRASPAEREAGHRRLLGRVVRPLPRRRTRAREDR